MSQNRVLVVEDQSPVGLDLQCMLSNAGFEVVGPVMTLEEAMFAAEQPDLRCAVILICRWLSQLRPGSRSRSRRPA